MKKATQYYVTPRNERGLLVSAFTKEDAKSMVAAKLGIDYEDIASVRGLGDHLIWSDGIPATPPPKDTKPKSKPPTLDPPVTIEPPDADQIELSQYLIFEIIYSQGLPDLLTGLPKDEITETLFDLIGCVFDYTESYGEYTEGYNEGWLPGLISKLQSMYSKRSR